MGKFGLFQTFFVLLFDLMREIIYSTEMSWKHWNLSTSIISWCDGQHKMLVSLAVYAYIPNFATKFAYNIVAYNKCSLLLYKCSHFRISVYRFHHIYLQHRHEIRCCPTERIYIIVTSLSFLFVLKHAVLKHNICNTDTKSAQLSSCCT